ncbi:MAG TPA: UDP-2,3-diacylglucosamine diphosphatase [Bacteroides sp.]|nr:UDP-2,3-diacylglucosamine diphosphatase [Bacteroides sp.]
MKEKTCIYFVSDLHLGMHPVEESRRRELLFVRWLEKIRKDAWELWLLGDVFDYWFEHKKVVPRGFTRVLGKLAELSDEGVKIHFFTGNHDIWVFDYLPGEIGMEVHRKPLIREWNGRLFLLGHGDGLWGKDGGYRLLQGIFKNPVAQWCYARLHPNGSAAFAQWWSKRSRMKKGLFIPFLGKDQEHQVQFARKELERNPRIDFFIFGHRHIPYDIRIGEKSRVICLGDWIENYTYAVFDGKTLQLKKFFEDRGEILRM